MLKKEAQYKKAIKLRYKGLSYNEILQHVSVAQSTISRWCCDIPLTRKQRQRLLEKKKNNPFIRELKKRAYRDQKEAEGWAREKIKKVFIDERLVLAGAMLYWAEGSRTNKTIIFTNTDPEMIAIMMRFFRKVLLVSENKFRITVRIGEEGGLEKAEKYWLRVTGLPRGQLTKPEILKLEKNSQSLGRHPYGICRISIYSVSLLRKILALIKEFSRELLLGLPL